MRMLIASDHKLIAQSLVTMMHSLSAQQPGMLPFEATTCEIIDAASSAEAARAEIMLMDASGGLAPVLTELRTLAGKTSSCRVVVLGTEDTDTVIFQVISAGAAGYITRDASPESLLATLYGVARGELGIPRATALKIVRQLAQTTAQPPRPLPSVLSAKLTRRESEIYGLVREGLRSNEIAERLSISNGTVYKHVQNILSKLQVHSRAQAVLLGDVKTHASQTGLPSEVHAIRCSQVLP